MAFDPDRRTSAPPPGRLALTLLLLACGFFLFFAFAHAGADEHPAGKPGEQTGTAGGEPALRDLTPTLKSDGSIGIDVQGINFLSGEIREAILSGVEARVVFEVELERHRTFWFDETVSAVTFQRSVKYDSLKDEYLVILENQQDGPEVVKELSTAEARMESLKDITLPMSQEADPAATYSLRARARLDSPDLAFPSVIRRLLFFAPQWGFDTGWVNASVKF